MIVVVIVLLQAEVASASGKRRIVKLGACWGGWGEALGGVTGPPHVYMYIYINTCVCIYMCLCVKAYVCIYIYIYTYTCVCICLCLGFFIKGYTGSFS